MTMQPDEFEGAYSKAVENGWDSVKDLARQIWDEARAQLPSQGGEAVEVVAYMDENSCLWNGTTHPGRMTQLMTVAQHQRILAAATHPAEQVAASATEQEIEWLEQWMRTISEPVGQECCGQAHLECCGNPLPVYLSADDIADEMNKRHDQLRAMLAKP